MTKLRSIYCCDGDASSGNDNQKSNMSFAVTLHTLSVSASLSCTGVKLILFTQAQQGRGQSKHSGRDKRRLLRRREEEMGGQWIKNWKLSTRASDVGKTERTPSPGRRSPSEHGRVVDAGVSGPE